MDLFNNIKLFDAFKKVVDSLYIIITIIRVISVVFLILQAITLITETPRIKIK